MPRVTIYIDGSSRNNNRSNPNMNAACAYQIVVDDKLLHEEAISLGRATNNQAELLAAIHAIKKAQSTYPNAEIEVFSDSQYLVSGANEWSKKWISKNFAGVKNPELWKELLNLRATSNILFTKVKGHANDKRNNRVNGLAQAKSKAS
jgi:ribonuclease HI